MKSSTYLPIGSIVLLNGHKKRVMIYGRRVTDSEGKKYDYMGCLYPEGNLNDGNTIVFNQDDISMLFFIGFQDIEELAYRQALIDGEKKQQ